MKMSLRTAKPNNEEEKEKIIKDFLPCVKYAAYRLSWRLPPHLTTDDLISAGLIGLMDAFNKFVEGKAKFKTYAELRIKGAMLDELRATDWIPRSMKEKLRTIDDTITKLRMELGRAPDDDEIANELKMPLSEYHKIIQYANSVVPISMEGLSSAALANGDLNMFDCIPDPNTKDPLNIIEEHDTKKRLAELIDRLSEKEKYVMSLYYFDELTMKETGMALNITESRVCQIHSQALMKLRTKLAGQKK
jgi:RNA polymerase sigma factor for flagellar operon FliA